jgi:hypothetical protein
VVEDQKLDESERFRAVQVDPDRELAQPLAAEVRGEVELVPDRLLDLGGARRVEVARDAQEPLRAARFDGDPAPRSR